MEGESQKAIVIAISRERETGKLTEIERRGWSGSAGTLKGGGGAKKRPKRKVSSRAIRMTD